MIERRQLAQELTTPLEALSLCARLIALDLCRLNLDQRLSPILEVAGEFNQGFSDIVQLCEIESYARVSFEGIDWLDRKKLDQKHVGVLIPARARSDHVFTWSWFDVKIGQERSMSRFSICLGELCVAIESDRREGPGKFMLLAISPLVVKHCENVRAELNAQVERL